MKGVRDDRERQPQTLILYGKTLFLLLRSSSRIVWVPTVTHLKTGCLITDEWMTGECAKITPSTPLIRTRDFNLCKQHKVALIGHVG